MHSQKTPPALPADANDNTGPALARSSTEIDTAPTRRSEVLRHIIPRPSPNHTSSDAATNQRVPHRATSSDNRRTRLSSFRHSRPRVAFHRVLASLFNHDPTRDPSLLGNPGVGSSASSIPGSTHNSFPSFPSLEVVSPETFLFSGPSLRSVYSGSSISRRPSLTDAGTPGSLRRGLSESYSGDSLSLLDEGVLEPFDERGLTRSMSDVLLGVATPLDELDGPIIEDLNEDDDLFMAKEMPPTQCAPRYVDTRLATLLCPYLDVASRRALGLTCRSWHFSSRSAVPPKYPAVYHVPVEIIQDIFRYLAPKDFNSARHTCRDWMHASLNMNLLVPMLKRGGWWGSSEHGLERKQRLDKLNHNAPAISDEWYLSRLLSRECSLSAGWTGNGLDTPSSRDPFVEVSETDFSDLANGYSGPAGHHGTGLVFSASICGRLLLVARETLIFVYELRGSTLQPLTTVTCPRRVLSMSMDVTSGRNAVAALLEGRMGMVCELQFGCHTTDDNPLELHVETSNPFGRTATRTAIFTSGETDFETGTKVANGSSSRLPCPEPSTIQRDRTGFSSVDVQANYDVITLQGADDERTHDQNWINHTWNLHLRGEPPVSKPLTSPHSAGECSGHMPIETGSSTFYRHLCSEDDPPRSVAICPQRRCVAFGCSAGIELHWIDALTGQSLSRWFPLTAPSDYLYFLPPRPGFESAKKLRLISSAAHPNHRPTINRKFHLSRPTISSFWGSAGFEGGGSVGGGGRPGVSGGCDHYRAVPLSDGHHVLFIDPKKGILFLGCDAPLGGPTKLLRKMLIVAPTPGQVPRLYAAAADLSWGARIVVAFDDTVMLYSVPPDVFALSRLEQKAESWDVYNAPPFSHEGRSRDHWLDWWEDDFGPARPESNPVWPILIRGVEVGTCPGVCELAVFTHPDITVWAFALGGLARTWRVRSEEDGGRRARRYVCRSGIVHGSQCVGSEYDGEVDMERDERPGTSNRNMESGHAGSYRGPLLSWTTSAPAATFDVDNTNNGEPQFQSVGFDGHSSETFRRVIPKALHVDNDQWVEMLDVTGCEAYYTAEGDVVVADET